MENKLCETVKKLEAIKFPRYADLPEIELYMDQVISVAEKHLGSLAVGGKSIVTPSMINNYVKNGIIPPPEKKRYTREHLAQIFIVCALKQTTEITDVAETMKKNINALGIERTFDMFAEMYEKTLSSLVGAAENLSGKTDDDLYRVAIDNAITASAARTVVEYALDALNVKEEAPKDPPRKKSKKRSAPAEDEDEISIFPVI